MSVIFASTGKSKPDIVPNIKSTGTAAVALSTGAKTGKFRLANVTAHAASNVASALTITLNSVNGATYDTLLSTNTNWTNLFVGFGEEAIFEAGDAIDVACADAVVVKGVVIRIELL